MEANDQQLADARRRGDPDQLAEVLVHHANTLVEAGKLAEARQALDEAADIHRRQGRTYDEARCTHLAATLCRLEGRLAEAKTRAQHADQLAHPGTPIAVSVATEFGDIALAEQNGLEAVAAYGRAIAEGRIAGLTKAAESALLRKRAMALVMSGHHHDAAHDLETAHTLLLEAGDLTTATRALVEAATALQQGGDAIGAEDVMRTAMQEARANRDDHALADLYLLQSAQAVERRDIPAATEAVQAARQHALAAVAPLSYISAAVAIAELAEISGNRLSAYEALAVGWVTLADLLGQEAAKASFEAKLLELRKRWGAAAFAEVKATYEAQRQAQMGI